MPFPTVSIIIPTYNAEKYLKRCLDAIFAQSYPRDRFEVIIADGGSTDKTLEILKHYDVTTVQNPARDCDDGKYLALQKAKGKVIALIDADNIVASSDWLQKMIKPLVENPDLLGVESNYLIADDFTSINTYANLLVIVDPLARMLASKPYQVIKKENYVIKKFSKGSSPVAGANGFLWRKSIIDTYNTGIHKFAEAHLLDIIAKQKEVAIANIPRTGIYHYYAESLKDYIDKRKKIAKKFLNREQEENGSWVQRNNLVFYLKVLYLGTIVGPTIEALYQTIKSKRIQWLWHPIVSFITIYIYSFRFIKKKI